MSNIKLPIWVRILFILMIGMWWLITFQYTMKWDIMDITLPWQYFLSESINAGELPLWNPFIKNGFPQMGLPDSWYPITWLIALLFGADVWSVQLSFLLHLFIAGMGMCRYLDHKGFDPNIGMAVATSYALSGFMIGNAQHLGWIIGAAWLPWVFYYFESLFARQRKGDFLSLAFVGALLFYGAYTPITIVITYILLAKLVYSLWNSSAFKVKLFELSKSLVFCLLLCLVGIVGLLDLLPNLNRGESLAISTEGLGILSGYFPAKAISSLLVPYAGGATEGFWGSDISLINSYFGFIPLVLGVLAVSLKSKIGIKYFIVGVMFLMIAMADIFPFRSWLYYLPFFDKFRFPSLFRLFFIFFLLLTSAYGFKSLQTLGVDNAGRRLKRIVMACLILTVGSLVICLTNINLINLQTLFSEGLFEFNKKGNIYDRTAINLLVHTVLLISLFAVIVFKKHVMKTIPYFIVLEVLIISQFNISETVVHHANPTIGNVEINRHDDRPLNIDLDKSMNTFADGYWSDELSWFRFNQACITKTPSPSGNSPFSLLRYKSAIANNDIVINENPLFFFGETVDGVFTDRSDSGMITDAQANNNNFELAVKVNEQTDLIFLQNNYKGWRALVNGEKVEIQKVNTTFMSVPLVKGKHRIVFQFRPMKMVYSFYISLITFLIVISGMVLSNFEDEKYYEPL